VPGPEGPAGPPGQDGEDGQDAVVPPELEARISALEAAAQNAAYCPRLVDWQGRIRTYTPDLTVPGVVKCFYGADEMVKVGSFWIDVYEATLGPEEFFSSVQQSPIAHGTCAGPGAPYTTTNGADPYPGTFPDNGNWTVPVYACSVIDRVPSRTMTWFQAQQACVLSGKRLCRNDEWQAAATGTPDPGDSPGLDGSCRTNLNGILINGEATGCRSRFGVENMIGNLAEWVADWHTAPGTDLHALASAGTWDVLSDDGLWNVSGTAIDPSGSNLPVPAAALRGGDINDASAAGIFALAVDHSPLMFYLAIGARCCAGN
jgi:formylglycine-generating enzyme required for sulfatase activity